MSDLRLPGASSPCTLPWAVARAGLAMSAAMAQQETVLYDIDFSAPKHTLNARPATGGSNGISLIRFGAPTVVSQFGPLVNRPLLLTGGGNPYDQIVLDGSPSAVIYQLDFDVVTQGLKQSGFNFTILFDSPLANQFSLSGTLDRIDRINAPTWEEGKVLHFRVTANYLTGRWTCRMDDVVVFDSGINGLELHSIRFSLGPRTLPSLPNSNVKVAVDNIRVVATPPTFLNPPTSITTWPGSPSGIDVTWYKAPWATSYQVFRSDSNEFSTASLLAETTSLFYRDKTTSPGKRYFYWIRAKSGDLLSQNPPSTTGIASLLPPASLTVTKAKSGPAIQLSWPPSVNAVRYQVYRSLSDSFEGAMLLAVTSDLHYTDTMALPGKRYFYWVRSANDLTESQDLIPGNGLGSLLPVKGLTTVKSPSPRVVELTWSPVDEAVEYTVFRSSTGTLSDAIFLGVTNGTDFSDATTQRGQDYTYWVIPTAIDGATAPPSNLAKVSWTARPDFWISRKGRGSVGKGIANTTGMGQSVTVTEPARDPFTEEISLSWLGDEVDEVSISGSRGDRRFDVRFSLLGNVTAEVITGRLVIPASAPLRVLKVSIEPKARLNRSFRKEAKSVMVQGIATQLPSHRDAVVIQAVSLPLPVSSGSGNVWVRPDPSDRL